MLRKPTGRQALVAPEEAPSDAVETVGRFDVATFEARRHVELGPAKEGRWARRVRSIVALIGLGRDLEHRGHGR
jgi:hypothetical protein